MCCYGQWRFQHPLTTECGIHYATRDDERARSLREAVRAADEIEHAKVAAAAAEAVDEVWDDDVEKLFRALKNSASNTEQCFPGLENRSTDPNCLVFCKQMLQAIRFNGCMRRTYEDLEADTGSDTFQYCLTYHLDIALKAQEADIEYVQIVHRLLGEHLDTVDAVCAIILNLSGCKHIWYRIEVTQQERWVDNTFANWELWDLSDDLEFPSSGMHELELDADLARE